MFLFVLVPISISWKSTAVRIDSINGERAADLQKKVYCVTICDVCPVELKEYHTFGQVSVT